MPTTLTLIRRAKFDYLKYNGRCPNRIVMSQLTLNRLLDEMYVVWRRDDKTVETLLGIPVAIDNRARGLKFRIE